MKLGSWTYKILNSTTVLNSFDKKNQECVQTEKKLLIKIENHQKSDEFQLVSDSSFILTSSTL